MDLHFDCTKCGNCCRNTTIELTVAEAIQWLHRGDEVQLSCVASPWSEASDADPDAHPFKHRSFMAKSGDVAVRVAVTLLADLVGTCPNLLGNECVIHESRPLSCRIYPARPDAHSPSEVQTALCPPEAWSSDNPVLQSGTELVDHETRQNLVSAREAEANDAPIKSRLCRALNLSAAALLREGLLVSTPARNILLGAIAFALANESRPAPISDWQFVTAEHGTVARLAQAGARVIHSAEAAAASFRYIPRRRDVPTTGR